MAWLSFLLTNFWKLALVLKVLFKFISLRDPINIKRFFSWFPEKSALFLVNLYLIGIALCLRRKWWGKKAIPITSKYSKITPHFFFFSSQPTHNTELGLANSVDLWVNSKSIFFKKDSHLQENEAFWSLKVALT